MSRARLAVVLLVATGALTPCLPSDRAGANEALCRTVLDQAHRMTTELQAAPPDAQALTGTLRELSSSLEVRDRHVTDQMGGDALVFQLNVRSALEHLAAGDQVDPARLRQAVVTFRSRECT